MRKVLLDTGPLVAFIDKSERNHYACRSFLQEFTGRLLTTEAVLTEAVYLLGPSFTNQKPVLDFFMLGGAELVPLSARLLEKSSLLMAKYADIPMDFADATLVALAEELGINEIFTLDNRDFTIYRTASKKAFLIFP